MDGAKPYGMLCVEISVHPKHTGTSACVLYQLADQWVHPDQAAARQRLLGRLKGMPPGQFLFESHWAAQ
jgi:hypothetical protein